MNMDILTTPSSATGDEPRGQNSTGYDGALEVIDRALDALFPSVGTAREFRDDQRELCKLGLEIVKLTLNGFKAFGITHTGSGLLKGEIRSAPKSEGDNAAAQACTPQPVYRKWSDLYPSASALLRSWESCPRVATEWDEKFWLRDLHRHWQEVGSPELTWQDDMVKAAFRNCPRREES